MFDTYDAIFAERAHSYQAAMATDPHARDAEFAAVLAPLALPAGTRLCDMPAGGGYLHRSLPEGIAYTAIEPTVLFAASCPTGLGCRVVRAPIEAVPLEGAGFDAIVSLAGLHHCPDMSRAFAEMRRLVQPGGTVVIADVAEDTPPATFLNGYVDRHNPLGHRGTFLGGATAGLLAAAGLVPIEDAVVPIVWRFADGIAAGRFAIDLFGLEGVTADAVGVVLEEELGVDGPGYGLRWPLRRIVCRAD